MPAPLLETKLYLPRPRDGLVPRPRLSERLDRGAAAKLLLVSAPAGFGKTTLLAEWLGGGPTAPADGRSAGWLSLDRGDNDPVSFWTYLVTALRTVAPEVGASELALLASPQPPPIQLILTTLLNGLGATGSDIVLVLDDYHLIDAHEVHDAMAFLIDHLPPRLHLVIASRADPAVPLARLRARGELVEIRAAELRFTPDEAAAYLNGVMGLALTAQDVAALEERTEGWIAALQLAALSMQGRDDAAGFIAGFAGDDRYIVDYLAEEVLQRQSGPVRDFLLQTSVLGRLNGPLCDVVIGAGGGKAMLEALDRGNLFLVPLDDRRQWYRYHHLFADVLRARLSEESPDLVQGLHRRASGWYAENNEWTEAIRHAMAAEDFERTADLVELAMPATRRDRQESTLRGWLELLPDELLQGRPVLSNGYAGALLATGEVEGVERHLRDAEHWLDRPGAEHGAPEPPETQMVVVDEEEFRRLPAGVAVHRAGLALMQGDPSATVAHAQRALGLLEDDDDLGRGAATALIGLASWASGDLVTAHEAYAKCMASMQRAGHVGDLLGCSIALADIQITQGRLREAMRTYEGALRLTPQQVGSALRGTADMYVGLSALHRERNDLHLARQLLVRSEELGEHNGLPQNRYRWRVAMARIRYAEGDLAGAVDLLDEAERLYVGDFSPNVRPVPALRARAWIVQGRLDDALNWARDQNLSTDGELSYLREYEHVTLARALLARYERDRDERRLDEAAELLERLLVAADGGHRTGSVIEILVLQALTLRMRGDVPAALVSLERALALAEPEGYVRTFVDEGAPMAALLQSAAERRISPEYVGRLLTCFGEPEDSKPATQGLVDPLSQRELEVLRLLGSDLGGPEIAGELIVSLNTVRTHTKNIYAKLGVNNRRAAVRRAQELDLMSRAGRRPSTVVDDE
ncbi:MAG: ATP-dependent transcriptional regulator, MalT-like, LuxR family [Marmoricola sp.]|nr:ATP-dependent transcriptional regulator, MalT-like, LuxR family [Marmoricola sp.]